MEKKTTDLINWEKILRNIGSGFAYHEGIFNKAGKMVDYRFLDVNPGFEKMTGLKREKVVGKTALQLFPKLEKIWFDQYGDVVLTGKPFDGEQYSSPIKKYFNFHAFRAEKNRFGVLFTDITKDKLQKTQITEARDFYLTLFEDFPSLIWRADTSGKCDYFNATWLEFTGRTMEQEYGYGWAKGVHPDDLKRCVDYYEAHFKKHLPFTMEYRLKRHDGEFRWITDSGRPFNDLDGKFAGYIGSCFDITDQKEVVEKANRERDLLNTTINSIPDLIFFKDKNSVYLGSNTAFAKEFIGIEREKIVGKKDIDFVKDKKLAELFVKKDREVMESRNSEVIQEWVTYANGNKVLLETVKTPIKKVDGTVSGLVGVSRDITERKRLEDSLAREHDLLDTLINSISDFIVCKDINGVYLFCNNSFADNFVGKSRSEIIGKKDSDIFGKNRSAELKNIMAKDREAISNWSIVIDEWDATMANKKVLRLETIKTPFKISSSNLAGLVSVSRDITDRVRNENDLKDRTRNLEIMNKIMINRELKMIELKKEISLLKKDNFSKTNE